MGYIVFVDLRAKSDIVIQEKLLLTWIMVHQEPSSFWSLVSPQMPMIWESLIVAATSLFKDGGVTDCEMKMSAQCQ